MKKFISFIALAAVMLTVAMSVPACNQGGGDKTAGLEGEKGKKVSVLIPGHNPGDAEAWQNKAVAAFKAAYPDVEVEFVVATWENWETKLLASISGDEPIDVINDGANNNPRFPLRGITQPVEPYINMENPNLHKVTMDSVFKFNGHYYVAVSETNTAVIYYNKTLFENEGVDDPGTLYSSGNWNFDSFARVAKEITSTAQKRFGYATNYPYLFFGANKTSALKLGAGAKYELNLTAPELRRSLQLIEDGWIVSKWSGYEGDPWVAFYKGTAAMLGDFQWIDRQILDARQLGLADFDYGVVPMPHGPDNADKLNSITAAGWAIGNGADCPNHAGKLIDMLVDAQADYLKTTDEKIDAAHVALYKELAQKPFCTNSYDSGVGGAYDLVSAIIDEGKSVSQALESLKPVYQRKIDEINNNTK